MTYLTKDPAAVLVYGFNWSSWLSEAGAAIASSNWSVTPSAGITITDLEHESGITKVRVAGGTLGQTYRLTNHVITDGAPPDEDERSHVIRIAER